jgi:hypothetical protein
MAVNRWWWATLVIVAGSALASSGWPSQEPERHWLAVNGNDWKRMGPDARLAYVEGFLAGAALSQAAGGARDSGGVRTELEQLGRSGRFRFPFAANVYASRMSDYYWWKDHLPLPTWYAFLEVNTTLGRPISDSVP